MKEVGIANAETALEQTFNTIFNLSKDCRFQDCTHTQELGCAVIMAVENGEIDMIFYDNFLKLQKEKAYFESSIAEKRKKDKDFGKMVKNYKKDIKKKALSNLRPDAATQSATTRPRNRCGTF